ncbi:MAG: NfeD family protein [Massiliimalia sp.]|jgi:membrane protein implicated in regulation of membrane protease activity
MLEMIIWGIILVLLIVVETMTAQLVSIWFAVGALAAFITSLFTNNLTIEISVFLAVSIVLLLVTRPFINKIPKGKAAATNADSSIGQVGIVIEPIDNLRETGRIQLNGLTWNARSVQNETIPTSNKVTVVRIEGVTAWVEPVHVKEPASVS